MAQATVPGGNPGNNPVVLGAGDFNIFNSFQPIVRNEDPGWGTLKDIYR